MIFMENTKFNFSTQDAQALINHAQSAPLQHLGHAEQVSNLLQKFHLWFSSLSAQFDAEAKRIRDEWATEKEKLRAEISELKAKLGISP